MHVVEVSDFYCSIFRCRFAIYLTKCGEDLCVDHCNVLWYSSPLRLWVVVNLARKAKFWRCICVCFPFWNCRGLRNKCVAVLLYSILLCSSVVCGVVFVNEHTCKEFRLVRWLLLIITYSQACVLETCDGVLATGSPFWCVHFGAAVFSFTLIGPSVFWRKVCRRER